MKSDSFSRSWFSLESLCVLCGSACVCACVRVKRVIQRSQRTCTNIPALSLVIYTISTTISISTSITSAMSANIDLLTYLLQVLIYEGPWQGFLACDRVRNLQQAEKFLSLSEWCVCVCVCVFDFFLYDIIMTSQG